MTGFRRAGLSLLCVASLIAGDTVKWGRADNGLRISLAKPNAGELHVTLQNLEARQVLILLGAKVGTAHLIQFHVFLETANGERPAVIYTGLGVVSGAVESLTMGLRAGESYSVVLGTNRYYVLKASETLARFIARTPCRLWVELAVKPHQCPNPATLDPLRSTLPCWHGNVTSNVCNCRDEAVLELRPFTYSGRPLNAIMAL